MNRVQAGRFRNRRISVKNECLRIHLGRRNYLLLTPRTVSHIQMIGAVSSPDVLSGFWRGIFAGWIPSQTLWLSSVLSARRNTAYTAKVTYHDGSASVLRINDQFFGVLISGNTLIS